MTIENQLQQDLLAKFTELNYSYRPDILDRAVLKQNFRDKQVGLAIA